MVQSIAAVNNSACVVAGASEEIRLMLKNVHLQKVIEDIDKSSNPQKLLSKAMTLPIFREFADKCLEECRTEQ